MDIAIIGPGRVGTALAQALGMAGHSVTMGGRDPGATRYVDLRDTGIDVLPIPMASRKAEVIITAASPAATQAVSAALGNLEGKVLIDAMNSIMARAEPYATTTEALMAWTNCTDIVKCFNCTGFENILEPGFGHVSADMFMAGDSEKAKDVARILALDMGFSEVYDIGGSSKFQLLEQFALFWVTLAQGKNGIGRDMAFKVIRRDRTSEGTGAE